MWDALTLQFFLLFFCHDIPCSKKCITTIYVILCLRHVKIIKGNISLGSTYKLVYHKECNFAL